MKPYLAQPYAGLARLLAGALVVTLLYLTGHYVGVATERHAARQRGWKECTERIGAAARARGYRVVRMALPCSEGAR